MRYTAEQMAKAAGCSIYTIKLLLCRAEFSHIQRIYAAPHKICYINVDKTDIDKLAILCFGRRKGRRWKSEI